jgi:GT2 family glycosyltransferase
MRISVVIATRNRKEDLERSLEGFLYQSYGDKEIIVIDNESRDGTKEMMAEKYPNVKYLWLPDNFDIRSINIGVEISTGDIIWRTDSDSHPETIYTFEHVIEKFNAQPDIDIICAEDIEVRRGNQVWDWYPFSVDKINIPEEGYKANTFAGTGAAIKRTVFNKIGGFWDFGFEEIDFCTRAIVAGFNIRYFPDIRVLHFATQAERVPAERWVRVSKQLIRYNWKYFPLRSALWRTMVVMLSQMLNGMASRLSPLVLLEGFIQMQATILTTYRNERQPVPKEVLPDITLGIGIGRMVATYYKDLIIKKFRQWRKK